MSLLISLGGGGCVARQLGGRLGALRDSVDDEYGAWLVNSV